MEWQTKHCLFCGPEETLKTRYERTFEEKDLTPEVFSARRQTEHFHYLITECRRCGLVFSREVLPDHILHDLYSHSLVTFSPLIDVLRRDYWKPLEPWVQTHPQNAALEIGCSTGFFLEELMMRGFQKVVGIEPSLEAKQKAHPAVRDHIRSGVFEGTKMFPTERFDLVCLFQTIDHLTDPEAILHMIRGVLKPGGLVYIICHDVEALQAKILGEKSPIIDIEHVYLFNKGTLARLLKKVGLEVVTAGDMKNSYPLEYWLHMLPLPRWFKIRLQTLLRVTSLGRFSPAIRAGNIYAIGREPVSSHT